MGAGHDGTTPKASLPNAARTAFPSETSADSEAAGFQIGNGIGALGEEERHLGRREPTREELEQWLRGVWRRHSLELGSEVRKNRVIREEWLPASRNH
jgi:hypothetical protein